jgi:hypothetical protein
VPNSTRATDLDGPSEKVHREIGPGDAASASKLVGMEQGRESAESEQVEANIARQTVQSGGSDSMEAGASQDMSVTRFDKTADVIHYAAGDSADRSSSSFVVNSSHAQKRAAGYATVGNEPDAAHESDEITVLNAEEAVGPSSGDCTAEARDARLCAGDSGDLAGDSAEGDKSATCPTMMDVNGELHVGTETVDACSVQDPSIADQSPQTNLPVEGGVEAGEQVEVALPAFMISNDRVPVQIQAELATTELAIIEVADGPTPEAEELTDIYDYNAALVSSIVDLKSIKWALDKALKAARPEKGSGARPHWDQLPRVVGMLREMMLVLQSLYTARSSASRGVATTILRNMIYEFDFAEVILMLLKQYRPFRNSVAYLADLAEVTHTLLRLIKSFSEEAGGGLQRLRRRRRRRGRRRVEGEEGDGEWIDDGNDEMEVEEEELDEVVFTFNALIQKFATPPVVSAYVYLLSHYRTNAATTNHQVTITIFLIFECEFNC